MATKKSSETTYTKDEVHIIMADVFAELVVKLKDPSLVIAGLLAMELLDKKLK